MRTENQAPYLKHVNNTRKKTKQFKTYSSCLRYLSDCPDWINIMYYQLLIFNVAIKIVLTRWSYIPKDVYMYFVSLSNAISYIVSLRIRITDADSNHIQGQSMHVVDNAGCRFTSSSTVMWTNNNDHCLSHSL